MMASKTESSSRLLDLPVEIRLKIYRSFFAGSTKVDSIDVINQITIQGKKTFISRQAWSLLNASKLIYSEAMPEYYRTGCFKFENENHLQSQLRKTNTNFVKYTRSLTCAWLLPDLSTLTPFRELEIVTLHTFS